jgi:hypothetical protein
LEGRSSGPRSSRFQVHPSINCGVVAFNAAAAACLKTIMLDAVYVGITVLFFAAFALYVRGCEKL